MKEYQCDKCHSRFPRPKEVSGFLVCPECGDGAVFPIHSDAAPVKRTVAQRRKKRGAQMDLFGKEESL
jgi:ribosomal protein L37AE/L43A